MESYEPMTTPDPEEWMGLDDSEKIDLVARWHRKNRVKLPSMDAHASIHVIVENQLAMGSPDEVIKAVERLRAGGLDRHQAIHAVGTALSGVMYRTLRGEQKKDLTEDYIRAVKEVTVESWLSSGPSDEAE